MKITTKNNINDTTKKNYHSEGETCLFELMLFIRNNENEEKNDDDRIDIDVVTIVTPHARASMCIWMFGVYLLMAACLPFVYVPFCCSSVRMFSFGFFNSN